MKLFIYPVLFIFLLAACNGTDAPKTNDNRDDRPKVSIPPIINYTVVNTHPHDTEFFTEGFEFHGDELLESSGGSDEGSPFPSALGVVNPKTGKVDVKVLLDRSKYFGEGITIFNGKLYMLTWQSGVGFIYDSKTYKKLGEFKLPTPEGWGLTHDSSSLIMSNGTNSLYFLDPNTQQVKNIVGVLDNSIPVSNINELEYVDGYIYANQWRTSYILKIDPKSGNVVGRIDLSPIASEIEAKYKDTHGLNGIAYNPRTNTFMVAGKKWPFMYEIKLQ